MKSICSLTIVPEDPESTHRRRPDVGVARGATDAKPTFGVLAQQKKKTTHIPQNPAVRHALKYEKNEGGTAETLDTTCNTNVVLS